MSRKIISIIIIVMCSLQAFAGPVEAVKGVIQRRIPEIKDRVTLIYEPQKAEKEYFEIKASDGHLVVKGNSAVAMCRGVYEYLKDKCGCLIVWEGSR